MGSHSQCFSLDSVSEKFRITLTTCRKERKERHAISGLWNMDTAEPVFLDGLRGVKTDSWKRVRNKYQIESAIPHKIKQESTFDNSEIFNSFTLNLCPQESIPRWNCILTRDRFCGIECLGSLKV
jgi:hypothetical protein